MAPMDRLAIALLVAVTLIPPSLAEPAPTGPRTTESLTLGDSRVWVLRDGEISLEASLLEGIDPAKARAMLSRTSYGSNRRAKATRRGPLRRAEAFRSGITPSNRAHTLPVVFSDVPSHTPQSARHANM
jgi:hypothetical protein